MIGVSLGTVAASSTTYESLCLALVAEAVVSGSKHLVLGAVSDAGPRMERGNGGSTILWNPHSVLTAAFGQTIRATLTNL